MANTVGGLRMVRLQGCHVLFGGDRMALATPPASPIRYRFEGCRINTERHTPTIANGRQLASLRLRHGHRHMHSRARRRLQNFLIGH